MVEAEVVGGLGRVLRDIGSHHLRMHRTRRCVTVRQTVHRANIALLTELEVPGRVAAAGVGRMVDPLPGPRTAVDFADLRQLAPHVLEITARTTARSPAGSSLPRLAADLPARIVLMDPSAGAVGMAVQIAATAQHLGANHLTAVDVGGDCLQTVGTQGFEVRLRTNWR